MKIKIIIIKSRSKCKKKDYWVKWSKKRKVLYSWSTFSNILKIIFISSICLFCTDLNIYKISIDEMICESNKLSDITIIFYVS